MRRAILLVAPYSLWMALLSILPTTAAAYAWRGTLTAALLLPCTFLLLRDRAKGPIIAPRGIFAALLVGVVVFGLWIAPEGFVFDSNSVPSSPYAPSTCGLTLTLIKLAASALVIPIAEELFFRKWLVSFAGFGWMVVLFAVEHFRADLGLSGGLVFVFEGALAGLAYGIVSKRFGLFAAILSHVMTNLLLGLYVIVFQKWFYW